MSDHVDAVVTALTAPIDPTSKKLQFDHAADAEPVSSTDPPGEKPPSTDPPGEKPPSTDPPGEPPHRTGPADDKLAPLPEKPACMLKDKCPDPVSPEQQLHRVKACDEQVEDDSEDEKIKKKLNRRGKAKAKAKAKGKAKAQAKNAKASVDAEETLEEKSLPSSSSVRARSKQSKPKTADTEDEKVAGSGRSEEFRKLRSRKDKLRVVRSGSAASMDGNTEEAKSKGKKRSASAGPLVDAKVGEIKKGKGKKSPAATSSDASPVVIKEGKGKGKKKSDIAAADAAASTDANLGEVKKGKGRKRPASAAAVETEKAEKKGKDKSKARSSTAPKGNKNLSEAEKEKKAQLSRKASAYHKVKRQSLKDGDDMDTATRKAKEVP